MSSLIIQYNLNSSLLGADSAGSSLDATNTDVTLVNDEEYGPVASFNGTTSVLTLPSASVPTNLIGTSSRTYVFWAKHDGSVIRSAFHSNGSNNASQTFMTNTEGTSHNFTLDIYGVNSQGTSLLQDTWYHLACTYDGSTFISYVNGVQSSSLSNSINTASSDLLIGDSISGVGKYSGLMTNFRIYSTALSATEILADSNTSIEFLSITPWSTLVQNSWSETVGSTSYRLTIDDGSTETTVDTTTTLESIVYNLTPEVSYTIRLYSSTDDVSYTLEHEKTISTLANTPENLNIEIFDIDGVFDISILNEDTTAIVEKHIKDVLVTGDTLVLNSNDFGNRNIRIISVGDTSNIANDTSILIPFNENEGSSQSVTLELLSDTSNVVVTYDDLTNTIQVDGVTRSIGDTFILDGKKVYLYDL